MSRAQLFIYYEPGPCAGCDKRDIQFELCNDYQPYMPFKKGTSWFTQVSEHWMDMGGTGKHLTSMSWTGFSVSNSSSKATETTLFRTWILIGFMDGWPRIRKETSGCCRPMITYRERRFSREGRKRSCGCRQRPPPGTLFRQMADEYTVFQKSDLEVALSTGLGPYQNAARLIWTDYTNMELQYLVPMWGSWWRSTIWASQDGS